VNLSDDITVSYGKQYTDVAPFIKKILDAHVRILLVRVPSYIIIHWPQP